jgi:hypothetical protein
MLRFELNFTIFGFNLKNRSMRTYLIIALLLFTTSAFSVEKDKKKTDGTGALGPAEGIAYSLPRTGLRIHVTAVQEKYFYGPYFQYAEAFLGLKGAPSQDSERWTITGIEIETFSEADPANVYKAMGDAAAMVSLSESGILAGINKEASPEDEGLAVSTFLGDTKTPDFPYLDLSLSKFYEKRDSTVKRAIVTKSLEEKAMEAAETVTKLRKRRFKSLANAYEEQLPDGRAYELMVEELAKLEEEYVGLFVGKTYKKSFDYNFDFVPGENSVSGEVVFRFAENKGVLPKSDLSGKPIVIDMKKLDELDAAQNKLQASKNPVAGESGIYYRMPGSAEIKILNGQNLMAIARATIAQYGTVAPFPESLLDGSYRITFHPKTGAVKSILDYVQ